MAIAHSKGLIHVGVVLGDEDQAKGSIVSPTAPRLFGKARYYV